jgi:hypothetical protein
LGIAPADRTVHYLDLGRPEIGVNPLTINASAGTRASVFLQALIEANPPGAIQAASGSFLRQAVFAVEAQPTLWDVYRMLGIGESKYRARVVARLQNADAPFARGYWQREFPALLSDRGPPRSTCPPSPTSSSRHSKAASSSPARCTIQAISALSSPTCATTSNCSSRSRRTARPRRAAERPSPSGSIGTLVLAEAKATPRHLSFARRLSRKSVERPGTLSGGTRATDSRLYRAVIPLKAHSAGL